MMLGSHASHMVNDVLDVLEKVFNTPKHSVTWQEYPIGQVKSP
jgi:hypothetical protein